MACSIRRIHAKETDRVTTDRYGFAIHLRSPIWIVRFLKNQRISLAEIGLDLNFIAAHSFVVQRRAPGMRRALLGIIVSYLVLRA